MSLIFPKNTVDLVKTKFDLLYNVTVAVTMCNNAGICLPVIFHVVGRECSYGECTSSSWVSRAHLKYLGLQTHQLFVHLLRRHPAAEVVDAAHNEDVHRAAGPGVQGLESLRHTVDFTSWNCAPVDMNFLSDKAREKWSVQSA